MAKGQLPVRGCVRPCLFAGALLLACVTPALAVVKTWIGGAGGNWDTPGNWSPANEPVANDEVTLNSGGPVVTSTGNNVSRFIIIGTAGGSLGRLFIQPGGRLNNALYIYVGVVAGASGEMEINGSGILNAGSMRVGLSGIGALTLQGGAVTTLPSGLQIGRELGSTGTVTVRDAGTILNTGDILYTGLSSSGSLNIQGGAKVNAARVILANNSAGVGVVTVDGAGSEFNSSSGVFIVGNNGQGTLNIRNGGKATAAGGVVAGYGANANSLGSITVDGAGSLLQSSDTIILGNSGQGTLTVSNGGTVSAPTNTLYLGVGPNATGTLNIGAGGAVGSLSGINLIQANPGPGLLRSGDDADPNDPEALSGNTPGARGAGLSGVNFNHNEAAYVFTPLMTGNLAVAQLGSGTTILTADHNYTGGTTISAGTLQLGNGGATGSVIGDILDNARLVIDRSNTVVYGGRISGAGTVTKNGAGTTVFTGDNTYTGTTTINAGVLQLGNGGATGSVAGDITNNSGLLVNRSNTFDYGGVISGGGSLGIAGGGTLVLNRPQTYTGATTVTAGTIRTTVANAIAASSSLTLQPGGTFAQAGHDQAIAAVTNAGLISIDGVPAGAKLTVNGGPYVGQGGSIAMNSFLGPDGSPSDRLVIAGGTAAGTTGLRITNTSGGGARTTGNGILVVDAANGGTTAASAFALSGRVVGGPYEYGLFRGGTNASTPDSWYLRTTGIRGETSLYPVLPAMGILYGGKLLDTLDQRWGAWLPEAEQGMRLAAGDPGNGSGAAVGAYDASGLRRLPEGSWGRIIYQHGKRDGLASGAAGVGPSFTHDFQAIQAGMDVYRDTVPDGHRVYGGIYGAIGHGEGEVTHFDGAGAGTNSFNAYTLGGYWTHFGPQNWYLDGIVQVTWYDAKGQGPGLPPLKTDAVGYSASLEAGYPLRLGDRWLLEPQAQLVWGKLDMDNASDAGGSVNFRGADSLMGRLGARLARTWNAGGNAQPLMRSIWGRLSTWRELKGKAQADFLAEGGPASHTSDVGGDWWELNGGVTLQINRSTFFTTSLSYYKTYDGKRRAADARIGLKVEW